jgi:acetylornithine/N-succinyldiaminopimelate aminotransferase
LWGHQHAGIAPDIMTLGKMLGGGVPLAALVATEQVSCFQHGDQGGTFNGNPLMTAVGCAIMDTVLEPGFLDNVKAKGAHLTEGLTSISRHYHLGDVRGRGLLVALDLKQEIANAIVDRARDAGLLLNAPRPQALRFMPALNVSGEEIDTMLKILDRTVDDLLK